MGSPDETRLFSAVEAETVDIKATMLKIWKALEEKDISLDQIVGYLYRAIPHILRPTEMLVPNSNY